MQPQTERRGARIIENLVSRHIRGADDPDLRGVDSPKTCDPRLVQTDGVEQGACS